MPTEIITFDDKYEAAFRDLNRQWIEQYFAMEPMDLHQLEHPKETILAGGGEIFFVVEDGKAVGAVAMVACGEKKYELAKMVVAAETRGKGYGDLLMKAAIDWAKSKGASEVLIL